MISGKQNDLGAIVSRHLPSLRLDPLAQTAIPELAKDRVKVRIVGEAINDVQTTHHLWRGDARCMSAIESGSVHLVVTSPPYFDLKLYPAHEAQLGRLHDYQLFLKELEQVWGECKRVLARGGRLIVVVGDVCRSRRAHGEHCVIPLHASIAHQCFELGFANLNTVIWHKIANASFEVKNGTSFLGKPYEPNSVIKNDAEFILMLRKPGGYRKPSEAARVLSVIGEKEHRAWFNQILRIPGASTRNHPAPYPVDLAERLIRMFSFVDDVVLDPFSGTGTTSLAAARCGRNSIGIEIESTYHELAVDRLRSGIATRAMNASLVVEAKSAS